MLEKMLEDYTAKFNENFPIFAVMDLNENELVKLIEQCITDGKRYEPQYEEGANY